VPLTHFEHHQDLEIINIRFYIKKSGSPVVARKPQIFLNQFTAPA